MATVGPPFRGRWSVSDDRGSIGAVNGDFVLGFEALDLSGSVLGRFPSFELALYALLHTGDRDARDCLVSPQ